MDSYRRALEWLNEAILHANLEKITDLNASARRVFRAEEAGALLGKSLSDLLVFPLSLDGGAAHSLDDLVAATPPRDPLRFEGQCRRLDGEAFHATLVIARLDSDEPPRRGASLLLQVAITELKLTHPAEQERLRKSEETLRCILESAPAIILTLDLELRVTSVNRSETPGFRPEQALGRHVLTFVSPNEVDHVKDELTRVLTTGEPTSYMTQSPKPNGEVAWHEAIVSALRRDGEIVGLTLISSNITSRKRLEQELRSSHDWLKIYADEMETKNRLLEGEIVERMQTEAALRHEKDAVRRMSTPIVKVWDGVLALPVIGFVDSERAAQMTEKLLHEIVKTGARFAILDLTGVEAVDKATAGYLLNMVRGASLLGSRCVLSGISPHIAQTMVDIGIAEDRESFLTFGELSDALRYALVSTGAARRRGGKRLV